MSDLCLLATLVAQMQLAGTDTPGHDGSASLPQNLSPHHREAVPLHLQEEKSSMETGGPELSHRASYPESYPEAATQGVEGEGYGVEGQGEDCEAPRSSQDTTPGNPSRPVSLGIRPNPETPEFAARGLKPGSVVRGTVDVRRAGLGIPDLGMEAPWGARVPGTSVRMASTVDRLGTGAATRTGWGGPASKALVAPGAFGNTPMQPTPRFVAGYQGPTSGPQLYQQRRSALRAGRLYTRLPDNSFRSQWIGATEQPSYEQWRQLLAAEARAVGKGQGNTGLTVVLGDSLSLWMPSQSLPQDQLWLNQGISGDTTTGILQRLHFFQGTRPQRIYVMAGINDLLQGASDATVVGNLHEIMYRLRQQHPQAEIVVQSILPVGGRVSNDRIRSINDRVAQLARQEGVLYANLNPYFADGTGAMRRDLTTDGIHLTALGYGLWQVLWQQVDPKVAVNQPGLVI